MFPTPFELKVLFWVCAGVALWLAWVVRSDHAELALVPRMWRNFENSITVFLMLLMLGASTVQVLARYVLPHRVWLGPHAASHGVSVDMVISDILDKVPVP